MKENKMAVMPMKKLFWKMGLPMIVSMVLQALYNVVDSIFVTNMGSKGAIANQALTIAFPVQITIIAVGVGTGVGLNALLSKSLGEQNQERVNKIAGNGIFLSIVLYLIFLVFGLFCSNWFISLFAGGNKEVIEMGTSYLKIVSCLSLGSIGFTVYERFLQATGRTMLSTIAQISGAVLNIVLDYIFIYPCNMGVAGAALATIIGQFGSLIIAMIFHYKMNHEINGNLKYIHPNWNIIKGIYNIGVSAAIMQLLLAVMMAGMNSILGLSSANPVILIGSFGIYYKIQQIALFSAFGLSNTIISILSFNYGMKDKERINDCIKYGLIDTFIVTLVLTIVFELFASPLSSLFGLSGGSTTQIITVCTTALKIASIGFVFMGVSVAIQGILQSLRYAIRPLIIAFLRLIIFVFPIAYFFCQGDNVLTTVWWTFPIAEILTALISLFILKKSYHERVDSIASEETTNSFVIAISREHGTNGKEIARQVAKELGISFFDKTAIKEYALNHVSNPTKDEETLYNYYLSLDVSKDSMIKQSNTIKQIANEGNCVIVGRAADYILRHDPNLVTVFLYASKEYRVSKIQEIYNDSKEEALDYIQKSDSSRSTYYELITNRKWGDKDNYDLCIDCKIGNEVAVNIICEYVKTIIK
ncbi:MAG: MATE family efflux transporter [Thomasclavelia sp.]|nr:MATE family efflux transporter [Thomasclavelia sp.]